MIITEIQYFFSKIIRFQAIFKDTVEFTCALEFKISSQQCYFVTQEAAGDIAISAASCVIISFPCLYSPYAWVPYPISCILRSG